MREDVRRDLDDSSYDFERTAWPEVRKWTKGNKLVRVEGAKGIVADMIDMFAGIDFISWRIDASIIATLATRVQWGKSWKSFTLRLERSTGATTEVEKRIKAILEHKTFPEFTCQAYVNMPRREGRLRYCCMTKTYDLFRYILKTRSHWNIRTNPDDNNLFIVIWVRELLFNGIDVDEFNFETKCKNCDKSISCWERDIGNDLCFSCKRKNDLPGIEKTDGTRQLDLFGNSQ